MMNRANDVGLARVDHDPWLVRPEPRPAARLRLFCFSYAGGGASIFRPWARELPPQIELCAVQLPGREGRILESPYTAMAALVERLDLALDRYLDRPFAFFGHSMGTLVSFELARQLRRRRLNPVQLLVSGHAAPQVRPRRQPIHRLADEAFVEQLRRLNGTPDPVLQNPELMELLLPMLRADLALCETYTYMDEAPLDCPISAFGGLRDPEVGYDDLDAWRVHTTRAFSLQMFAGDHFFLRDERPDLLAAIRQRLTPLVRDRIGV